MGKIPCRELGPKVTSFICLVIIFRDAEGVEETMEEGLCCFEGCG